MKLEEVKDKIDNFFETISAEELYRISILDYGFKEIFENCGTFKRVKVNNIHDKERYSIFSSDEEDNLSLVA
ncbi:hypothetical protein EDL99_10790 [Ornithobacterium rhinotracheale]|uniref:hypothetical protein n=1 Tax=Ornithobacterium rhinotracheale TaxID=28251 RepID=UPI00129CA71E|nr:hypothetical protein [Ornithobacterium rhinotracheale]MRJ09340.1 hypothetical protein [Ornithobacterium rhinotracheale]UOH77028.1 hypothetical protein MT996_07310 [Ornithobacterium rhinotracheale]